MNQDPEPEDSKRRRPPLLSRLRAVLIVAALGLGPAWLIAGSILAGRAPQGPEWLDTVLLVPSISLIAMGVVVGFFAALDWVAGAQDANRA